MIKIFYKNKTLFLIEKPINKNNFTKIVFSDKDRLKILLNYFLENYDDNKNYFIYNSSVNEILEELKKYFCFIKAAGGIVKDKNNNILFIYKRNKWDLPKGKVDKNESDDQAAIREVCEECGISNNFLKIENKFKSSYHVYFDKFNYVLKQTIWFNLKYYGNENILPQTDEEIELAKWVSPDEIQSVLKNSYSSIKNLFNVE